MREPWQTLLGHLADRWMLKDHLAGTEVPRVRDIQADERWPCLSSGEQAMVIAAGAILTLNECWLAVDETNRRALEHALRIAIDGD